MATQTIDAVAVPSEPSVVEQPRQYKLPIFLTIATLLLAAIVVLVPRHGDSNFRLTDGMTDLQIPAFSLPGEVVQYVVLVLCVLITAFVWLLAYRRARVPMLLPAVFGIIAVFAFLTWAAAGSPASVGLPSLFWGALSLSVPLVFGALGGVIGERAGIVNVAIEAQLLLAAFAAAVVSSGVRSALAPQLKGTALEGVLDPVSATAGLVGAMFGGMVVAFILAAFAIRYLVEQVIVGVVLNVLIGGLTSFLFSVWLEPNAAVLNTAATFKEIKIPLLSEIPVIGPALFNQTIIVYLMYIVVAVVAYSLYRTRWGLRLRAVGEYPKAADTVGIKVNPTRFWNVILAGAIVGIGGAYFTIVSVPKFTENMTGGLGFIALAAVIFGRWDPIKATLAALLFGFATKLQDTMTVLQAPVPKEFMLMLPYVVTLIAVSVFAGQITGPAASGKPYIKG